MAKSVLDILIKLSKQGNADKETITGLVKLKSSFMDAAAVAGSLVAAGYAVKKVFDETVGTMVEYADQVRTTSRATQLSSEESSKLIQMTDDLGVSYDGLEKAIKSSSDTTDFSIAGLMKTSEEYLKITDAQERAKFAQKEYGKAWIEMVGVLEKGPAAIQAASDAISSNLILTDEAVRQAREYEIALDNVNDSWTGLTVTAGAEALPMLNTLLLAVQKNIDAGLSWRDVIGPVALFDTIKSLVEANKELNPVIDSGTQSYMAWANAAQLGAAAAGENASALDDAVLSVDETQKAIERLNAAQMSATGSMQSNFDSYRDNYKQINEDINLSDEERKIKLGELATQHELDSKRIVLSMLEQQLAADGLQTHEMEALLKLGVQWGIYSQEVVDEAQKAMAQVGLLKGKIDEIPVSKTFTLYMQSQNQISIPGSDKQGRAAGGPVNANQVYVVGEKGPELFVSNESGTIIPNGGFNSGASGSGGGRSGNVTINLYNQSAVSVQEGNYAQNVLYPFIESAVSRLRSEGKL